MLTNEPDCKVLPMLFNNETIYLLKNLNEWADNEGQSSSLDLPPLVFKASHDAPEESRAAKNVLDNSQH